MASSPNPEQLPAYSGTAGPVFTPANAGDDALLPEYTFPTKFKIGGVFTEGLLVNIEQIKGHLALLNAFSNLKNEVEGLTVDIKFMPKDLEKRWAWFVGLAVERHWRTLSPPLDVLMVWHSYMLNPRWYTEDGQRILACKPLVDLGQVLGKELHRLPSLLDSPPTEARVNGFYNRVGLPFDPIQSASVSHTKAILCPRCCTKIVVPYMKSDGTGYLQTRFRVSCTTDGCPVITKEVLCARKLAENLSCEGMAPDSYLPGTFLTESRAADQKAGKLLVSSITQRYTVDPIAGDQRYNGELCLKILHGANYSLAEIRGQFKKNKFFMDLMASSPASFFVPTLDIDLVWHTHQLMNAKYEADCKRYVGRFIDQCVLFHLTHTLFIFELSLHKPHCILILASWT
ncbi:hypothetical protein H1R20_g1003, partial [Candolleomyces eurysporus]